MVERQKAKYGWEFLFLGANIDVVAEAGMFGITPEREVKYECDEQGTEVNYRVLNNVLSSVRRCDAAQMSRELSSDWKQEIEADYSRRHR